MKFRLAPLSVLVLYFIWPAPLSLTTTQHGTNWGITESTLAPVITDAIRAKTFPPSISLPTLALPPGTAADFGDHLKVTYTLDPALQQEAQRLLRKYNPDFSVLVAIHPDTGHILAMHDSSRNGGRRDNLAMVATYPAASVSKIITAVAAINEGKANATSVFSFNGRTTAFHKKNVFQHQTTQHSRHYTLTESFAKSVNSVFGRLGATVVGGELMLQYAHKLGFNAEFASDIRFDNGRIELRPDDAWQVAEMASGYTNRNTLSPLHAATLAATAVNGGNLVAPVVVESIIGPNGVPLYQHVQPAISQVMQLDTAKQLQALMQATVHFGSARKSFARFHRKPYADVLVGGKTGSLRGDNPPGQYDWFVGFGHQGEKKLAIAALCINQGKWYVKSARLARELLEFYFAPQPTPTSG